MRKLVIFLSLTTLGFAVSTAWFAWQAHDARLERAFVTPEAVAASDSAAAAAQAMAAEDLASSERRESPADPRSPANHAASPQPGTAPQPEFRNPYAIEGAKKTLQIAGDPALRAQAISANEQQQRAQLARFRERVRMDDATFDKLVNMLADDMQLAQEPYARCILDPACDMMNVPSALNHQAELVALLGQDRYAKLQQYRTMLSEWQSVAQLRSQLSQANYLGDADAERLMMSMTEVREAFYRQAIPQGAETRGFGNMSGMVQYLAVGTVDQQLASAADYSQQMRDHAATVLNAEQMRVFNQLQDDLLAALADNLKGENRGG